MTKNLFKKKNVFAIVALSVILATVPVFAFACKNGDYSKISTDNAWNQINNLGSTDEITLFNTNDNRIKNTTEFESLKGSLDEIKGYGKTVGFLMVDIKTAKGIAYNIDFPWVSQSTIKAPYVASLLKKNPQIMDKYNDDIYEIMTLSSNSSYTKLRNNYGTDSLEEFFTNVGVNKDLAKQKFPDGITVRDMAKIWTGMYGLLNPKNHKSEEMIELARMMEHTAYSSIQDVMGRVYKTQCKAGWDDGLDLDKNGFLTTSPIQENINGDITDNEIATNDTGIVYSGDNPYILVTFSNFAGSPFYLYDLDKSIDKVHDALIK